MTAIGQDVTMYQGDHKEIVITVYDENGYVSTDPALNRLDITGSTVNWVVHKKYPGGIIVTKTTTSGIALSLPVSGELTINLIPSDTLNYSGDFLHECEVTDSGGNIATVTVGKFTIFESKA
jgi:hypothetical protein